MITQNEMFIDFTHTSHKNNSYYCFRAWKRIICLMLSLNWLLLLADACACVSKLRNLFTFSSSFLLFYFNNNKSHNWESGGQNCAFHRISISWRSFRAMCRKSDACIAMTIQKSAVYKILHYLLLEFNLILLLSIRYNECFNGCNHCLCSVCSTM